jgi:centromeric protein E
MQGSADEPGIIPLAVHDVFDSIDRSEGREFLVRVSYLEIYNEQMLDLFAAESAAAQPKPQMGSSGSRDLFGSSVGGGSFDRPDRRVSRLQIKEDSERGVYVSGLMEKIVTNPTEVLELLRTGVARRHVGETNMNAESSRSHTIFRMVVESRAVGENASGSANGAHDAVLVATLNLVDLAGSERVLKTGAEGIRMKEGANINKSLLNLGIVINKLTEGAEGKGSHIPFRDSKLTRILQPALGGNSRTAIVCNVTPAAAHAEETHSTLRFAVRAKRVCNNATVNEVVSESALIKRQQREIEELREKLGGEGGVSQEVEDEINNLRREMLEAENERERLANELEMERDERERAEKAASAKINNLTNLVLKSSAIDADGAGDKKPKRGNRRETWAPNNRGGVPDFLKGHKLPPGVMDSFNESPEEEEEEAPADAPAVDPAAEAKAKKERRVTPAPSRDRGARGGGGRGRTSRERCVGHRQGQLRPGSVQRSV